MLYCFSSFSTRTEVKVANLVCFIIIIITITTIILLLIIIIIIFLFGLVLVVIAVVAVVVVHLVLLLRRRRRRRHRHGRKKPYSFFDDLGNVVGFDVDIVSRVCAIAGKQCEIVLAEFTECTFTNREITYPGRGLMSGWFDACPGYVISVDRKTAFDFTDPYLYTDASFTVAPGNPSDFNPDISDFSQFTFAHLTGAVTNEKCLDRLNKKAKNFVVAANLPDARAMLLNGTADVLFSPRHKIDGLEILPQRVHCDAGGSAVMLKRGSPLAQWWNPAFQTLKKSGEYQALCPISSIKYNAALALSMGWLRLGFGCRNDGISAEVSAVAMTMSMMEP
ncbi:arginine-binding periplasmic protein [Elysia marginata]|uniref:Arginine-binding periplasmic protein n=1 Tax=Elysia marginata TaxID=1093978 RepID=A0AAV4JUW0_9GAST|nr:arginine-binding periplasmic protein [Elysia marginata]